MYFLKTHSPLGSLLLKGEEGLNACVTPHSEQDTAKLLLQQESSVLTTLVSQQLRRGLHGGDKDSRGLQELWQHPLTAVSMGLECLV